jgi:hypothetical protein
VRLLLATAVMAITLAALTRPASTASVSAADLLAKCQAYLTTYDRALAALVADEHYRQREVREDGQTAERRLESEFAWVPLPSGSETIGVRDVRRVDGEPVSGNGRLQSLLEMPTQAIERQVRAILDESARHNLAPAFQRNINFPTFALSYLRPAVAENAKWKARLLPSGEGELRFREDRHRTLVRSHVGEMMPAKGTFTLDPSTGRVLECVVVLQQPHRSVRPTRDGVPAILTVYLVSVRFAKDDRLGVWVPMDMHDEVSAVLEKDPEGHRPVGVTGEARYDGYRRFEATGRIVR